MDERGWGVVVVYDMLRSEDVSGISGTGKVAEVVQFTNGKCVVGWLINPDLGVASVIVYDSLEDVERIHGHNGATLLVATVPLSTRGPVQ